MSNSNLEKKRKNITKFDKANKKNSFEMLEVLLKVFSSKHASAVYI